MRRFWIKLPEWTSGPFDTPEEAGARWPRKVEGLSLPRLWAEETDSGAMTEATGAEADRALAAMLRARRRGLARSGEVR